jgi:hypothetical protein
MLGLVIAMLDALADSNDHRRQRLLLCFYGEDASACFTGFR